MERPGRSRPTLVPPGMQSALDLLEPPTGPAAEKIVVRLEPPPRRPTHDDWHPPSLSPLPLPPREPPDRSTARHVPLRWVGAIALLAAAAFIGAALAVVADRALEVDAAPPQQSPFTVETPAH